MKIRAIELRNVRRFGGQAARIAGIGDGITTICSPNESGKSTFFDALHAAFFADHKSQAAEVKALQPYSKGAVEVSVEIETGEGRFRIEKRFLSSKSARVIEVPGGRILAQEGEAEAWIARLLGADGLGPSGLLWVRQGMAGFGPEGSGPNEKRERERLRDMRRTLVSTVAGQIDAVTSGRKMDAIMRRCEAEIDKLANKTGTPKAGGPWHAAAKEAERLWAEHTRLTKMVDELSEALALRRKLRADLERRSDPEAADRREAQIREVEKSLDTAGAHAARIAAAERELKLATIQAETALEARASRKKEHQRRRDLEESAALAEKSALGEAAAGEAAARTLEDAAGKRATARENLKAAREGLRRARLRAETSRLVTRKREIDGLLSRLAEHEGALMEARKTKASTRIDRETLERIEALERRRASAEAARAAGAAAFRVGYDGAARLTGPAGPIAAGDWHPVLERIQIAVPGIGHLELVPAAGRHADDDPAELAERVSDALGEIGFDDLPAARRAMRAHDEAEARAGNARVAMAALAPSGVEVLRAEAAEIGERIETQGCVAAEEGVGTQDQVAELERVLSIAESVEAEASDAVEAAKDIHQEALRRSAARETEARLARQALEVAQAQVLEEVDEIAEEARIEALRAAVVTRRDELESLRATAPDMEALEAERDRLVSARDSAIEDRRRLNDEISRLTGLIAARGEDNVEARLAETTDALLVAEERERRYATEVEALKMLLAELDGARRLARDAYFGPVYDQLRPLLGMLHEGAEIEMDGETMLPSRLVRGGVVEEIENLSGGASEQIAILTRLAFARLAARSGRSVPVILDDALVFSDDERIVRMFTALTRISKDQQIIVFSCRQRAFEDLGGRRASIEVAAA